ncbi:MAG: hypothetical protein E7663_01770 [Ruminococcaceae bacterium]|nr:hypothetical protein [Oscillospiraceae bacterium]
MEIYPLRQLTMLVAALLAGLFLGALADLGRALRILLCAYRPPSFMLRHYQSELPLLGRAVGERRERRLSVFYRGTVLFFGDLVFCLVAVLLTELLLFRYNNGGFRVAVPLLLLLGLFFWSSTVSRLLAHPVAWLAFFFAAGALYLAALCRLPFRIMRHFAVKFLITPSAALARHCRERKLLRCSAALCRNQLAAARMGFFRQ